MVDSYQPLIGLQWQVMACLLPVQRKRRMCLRQVFNTVLYVFRTGYQWRALPPPSQPGLPRVLLLPLG